MQLERTILKSVSLPMLMFNRIPSVVTSPVASQIQPHPHRLSSLFKAFRSSLHLSAFLGPGISRQQTQNREGLHTQRSRSLATGPIILILLEIPALTRDTEKHKACV